MTHEAYSTKRVTVWPQEKNGEPGYAIKYPDGYLSWCPRDVYVRDYQPTDAMSFGHAIHALKRGRKVARAGWNGKGMWVAYQSGSVITPELARGGAAKARADEGATEIAILGHIDMRSADGSIVVGWLASQTDMTADDWTIVS